MPDRESEHANEMDVDSVRYNERMGAKRTAASIPADKGSHPLASDQADESQQDSDDEAEASSDNEEEEDEDAEVTDTEEETPSADRPKRKRKKSEKVLILRSLLLQRVTNKSKLQPGETIITSSPSGPTAQGGSGPTAQGGSGPTAQRGSHAAHTNGEQGQHPHDQGDTSNLPYPTLPYPTLPYPLSDEPPMIEMLTGSNIWYQGHVIKETFNEAKIWVPGSRGPKSDRSEWIQKGSCRIWAGSYKTSDWRHLGRGAWRPRSGLANGPHGKGALNGASPSSTPPPPPAGTLLGGPELGGGSRRSYLSNGEGKRGASEELPQGRSQKRISSASNVKGSNKRKKSKDESEGEDDKKGVVRRDEGGFSRSSSAVMDGSKDMSGRDGASTSSSSSSSDGEDGEDGEEGEKKRGGGGRGGRGRRRGRGKGRGRGGQSRLAAESPLSSLKGSPAAARKEGRREGRMDPLAAWFEAHYQALYGLHDEEGKGKEEGASAGTHMSEGAAKELESGDEQKASTRARLCPLPSGLGPLPFSDRPEAGAFPPGYSYDQSSRSISGPLDIKETIASIEKKQKEREREKRDNSSSMAIAAASKARALATKQENVNKVAAAAAGKPPLPPPPPPPPHHPSSDTSTKPKNKATASSTNKPKTELGPKANGAPRQPTAVRPPPPPALAPSPALASSPAPPLTSAPLGSIAETSPVSSAAEAGPSEAGLSLKAGPAEAGLSLKAGPSEAGPAEAGLSLKPDPSAPALSIHPTPTPAPTPATAALPVRPPTVTSTKLGLAAKPVAFLLAKLQPRSSIGPNTLQAGLPPPLARPPSMVSLPPRMTPSASLPLLLPSNPSASLSAAASVGLGAGGSGGGSGGGLVAASKANQVETQLPLTDQPSSAANMTAASLWQASASAAQAGVQEIEEPFSEMSEDEE